MCAVPGLGLQVSVTGLSAFFRVGLGFRVQGGLTWAPKVCRINSRFKCVGLFLPTFGRPGNACANTDGL